MKFKIIYTFFLLAGGALLLLNNSSGAAEVQNADRTNSPLSNAPCTACHSSGAFSPSVALAVLDDGNPIEQYTPGETYQLRVTANHTGSPASFGFQAVALAGSDNAQAGSFSNPPNGVQITPLNGRQYPEHSQRNESNVFEVDWTAPASGTGEVRFYSSVVAANNGAGSGGDGSAFLQQPVTIAEGEPNSSNEVPPLLSDFRAFPNPTAEVVQLELESQDAGVFAITAFNLMGQAVYRQQQAVKPGRQIIRIAVQDWPAGLYQVQISDGQRQNSLKLIKR